MVYFILVFFYVVQGLEIQHFLKGARPRGELLHNDAKTVLGMKEQELPNLDEFEMDSSEELDSSDEPFADRATLDLILKREQQPNNDKTGVMIHLARLTVSTLVNIVFA